MFTRKIIKWDNMTLFQAMGKKSTIDRILLLTPKFDSKIYEPDPERIINMKSPEWKGELYQLLKNGVDKHTVKS